MPFPDSTRVIYQKNPLTEVICQLRFPPILRIDAEAPAAFQEKVRQQYPLYQEAIQQDVLLPQLPKQIAQRLSEELGARKLGTAHDFLSAEGEWTVGLTRDFLALSTRVYERWEQFAEHLELPFQALREVYSPPFFTRIGLRYQNVIQRSALELEEVGWSELLQPYIIGELSSPVVAKAIEFTLRHTVIRLAEGNGHVRISHGLVEIPNSGEACYMIDSDFYSDQKTEPQDAFNQLKAFNMQARRLFRWCITDRLHQAMGPQPI